MLIRSISHIFLFFSLVLPNAARAQEQSLVLADHQKILASIESSSSEFVLVNMWATWCSPCLEEFPDLVQLDSLWRTKGAEVIFVSVDFAEQFEDARQFIKRNGWSGLSFFKDEADNDFVNGISEKWSGAIPATFIFDASSELVWMQESKTSLSELDSVLTRLTSQSAN